MPADLAQHVPAVPGLEASIFADGTYPNAAVFSHLTRMDHLFAKPENDCVRCGSRSGHRRVRAAWAAPFACPASATYSPKPGQCRRGAVLRGNESALALFDVAGDVPRLVRLSLRFTLAGC